MANGSTAITTIFSSVASLLCARVSDYKEGGGGGGRRGRWLWCVGADA